MNNINTQSLIQVLIPHHLFYLIDYLGGHIELNLGDLVKVPFQNKEFIGVVWSKEVKSLNFEVTKLRKITSSLTLPSITVEMLKFISKAAEYNLISLGNIFKMVLPAEILTQKTFLYYKLNSNNYSHTLLTKRHKEIVNFLANHPQPLRLIQIINALNTTHSTLNKLIKKHIIIPTEPLSEQLKSSFIAPDLSIQQYEVVNFLTKQFNSNKYSVNLIDGVTGSGKTEVYFSIIAKAIANFSDDQTQVLLLLPEIILTTQLISRFKARFGFDPELWHSDLSTSQRQRTWLAAIKGQSPVIIGTRSALFLPFKNLKLIIVDEEQDSSYKQEEKFIYQARDMAILRGYLTNIMVILASATPSLETIRNCQLKKFNHLHLPNRFGTADLPHIMIANMRTRANKASNFISELLRQQLEEKLILKEQAILFLNRRGYSPLILCGGCGFRFTCPDCASWLVYHKFNNQLKCHHCSYTIFLPSNCPTCHQTESFIYCGPGVERIQEEILQILPTARILIITKDTVDNITKSAQAINDILDQKFDIIIGTQMIAKGHHFPNLTLIGIIDADLGLFGGDLRGAEKNYQLLQQVSGRAGRELKKGTVVIQTYNPDNPLIEALKNNNQAEFITNELQIRMINNMPPFSKLVAIIISSFDEQKASDFAKQLVRVAPTKEGLLIMGPVAAVLAKIRNYYRFRILIKADKKINVQNYLNYWLSSIKVDKKVKIKIDIDPYYFL